MATEPGPPFRISWSQRQLQNAASFGETARRVEVSRQYAADLMEMQHRLAADPLGFGDPQYHYRHLGLVVYHAILKLVQVRYAVDEARRIVYIEELTPVPGRALDP